MDKDRIKGSAEQAGGAIKEGAGKALGDKKMETEGKAEKAEGKVRNAVGGAKDAVREAVNRTPTRPACARETPGWRKARIVRAFLFCAFRLLPRAPAGIMLRPMVDETIDFDRAGHRPPAWSGERGGYPVRASQVRFDRDELKRILNIYGRMVIAGEWRDYAIDFLEDAAVFSIFRRSSEMALYRVEKRPHLRARQGQYAVIAATGTS